MVTGSQNLPRKTAFPWAGTSRGRAWRVVRGWARAQERGGRWKEGESWPDSSLRGLLELGRPACPPPWVVCGSPERSPRGEGEGQPQLFQRVDSPVMLLHECVVRVQLGRGGGLEEDSVRSHRVNGSVRKYMVEISQYKARIRVAMPRSQRTGLAAVLITAHAPQCDASRRGKAE